MGKDHDQSMHAIHLAVDRQTSMREIRSGIYRLNADRSFLMYQFQIPPLEQIVQSLCEQKTLVKGLDVGCGTGRAAAEIMIAHPALDMQGVTLVYHPPVEYHKFLPRNKIRIAHAGNTGFPNESFDFLIAVGSFDTSDTLEYEGNAVLQLVAKGGFFIFNPCVLGWGSHGEMNDFKRDAIQKSYSLYSDKNEFGYPYYIFRNDSKG